MEGRCGRLAWCVLLLLLQLWTPPAVCVAFNKCSACQAVAGELEIGLANERPRNHLDMRHRLDSRGQREGKLIDYKVSELRVVELLDGLCTKMKEYILNRISPGKELWLKAQTSLPELPNIRSHRQEAETHSKAIIEFCGRLLETTEEELTDKIRNGDIQAGDVERVLCQELSKNCKKLSKEAVEQAVTVETSQNVSDGEL